MIGVIANDPKETRAFLAFTRHFAARGIPVPRLFGEDSPRGFYLMEDLGRHTLFQRLSEWRQQPDGEPKAVKALERVVRWLPVIQVRGGDGLDYALCQDGAELDGRVLQADLERFLAHYLPRFVPAPAPVEGETQAELGELVQRLDRLPRAHFCYRDFQVRNIMWVEGESESGEAGGPVFLDYQSGRRGPLAYDLASLLYSPDSGLEAPARKRLIGVYLDALAGQGVNVEREDFLDGFYPLVLLRRLQALGAYAHLALEKGKPEYLDKIPPALADLRGLLGQGRFNFGLPALERWLAGILAE